MNQFQTFEASDRRRLHALLEAVFDPVVLVERGTIVDCNQAAETLLSRPGLIGSDATDFLPRALPEIGTSPITLRRANGSTFSANLRVLSLEPDLSWISIQPHTDVSEQKRGEETLRTAQDLAEVTGRAKNAFLANMSHEIRTPLTGIIGFAALLAQESTGDHRTFAEIIEQSGRRLMETLDAILTLARLESGRFVFAPESIDLVREVTLITQPFQRQASEKGLDLFIEVEPEARDLKLPLDRGALTSIMQNLLSNAIKYTDVGRVKVRIGALDDPSRGRLASICIVDTGIGITPSFLPHLFETFMQETSDDARPRHGTGLGLSITRQLIEKMNGAIEVESEKGRGTRFTITFPLQENRAPAPPPVELPAEHRARVLVVEDNTEAAFLAKALLRKHYEVQTAPAADEAFQLATENQYDLLFIDINLGVGPDGIQLMNRLRQIPEYAHVPIVALTAYALPGDRERFLEAGFDSYLSKPFTADALLTMAERMLQKA